MTSLFSKPRALTSHITNFKTYRPVIGKLHVATLTLLLFLIAAGIAVTSSLWLNKTTKAFDRPTLVATKPEPELEPPHETGVLVNCTSFLNQNRSGSCSRTPLLNKVILLLYFHDYA
ncbi:hypothetical protein AXX17_AT1G56870 [Arabidopsis thaliana]|uniref:Transmembrane protein n=1 Tax=Arabidopsis thaliana TaxID=3702 RepID=A0A178WFG0_ARATH|nr:hypothetical protein AXX17_AT1G56870 [Arabidopsis thaliana]